MKVNDFVYLDENWDAVADFCNKNNYVVVEVKSDTNLKKYQIQNPPSPSRQEYTEHRIRELKKLLFDTDYQAIKFAEGEFFVY